MKHRQALPPGLHLSGYEITQVLGAGGFGITYKALDMATRQIVAIKEYFPNDLAIRESGYSVIPPSQAEQANFEWGLDRFLREAAVLTRFNHPNIVRVLQRFRANNSAYIILSYEAGENIRQWLNRIARQPNQNELDALLEPIIDALSVVHDNGLLHRDLSPDNILLRFENGPVLLDFGAARQAIGMRSGKLSAIVKHGFSPPEQYAANPKTQGPWSDIYSLAATMYYCITRSLPPGSLERVDKDNYTPLAMTHHGVFRPDFLEAIDWAMSVSPGQRPQTVVEWRAKLFANRSVASPAHHPSSQPPGQAAQIPPPPSPPTTLPGAYSAPPQPTPPQPTPPQTMASLPPGQVPASMGAGKFPIAASSIGSGTGPPSKSYRVRGRRKARSPVLGFILLIAFLALAGFLILLISQ